MKPEFPEFAKITLESREVIESYTHQYQPFSDFNFYSLWCWDTSDQRSFSILNDNLVVRMTDYATEAPVLTFLGDNKLGDTAKTLLAYSQTLGIEAQLQYVPAPTAEKISNESLIVKSDRGNFDYIFSVADLCALAGNKFKSKRRLRKRFLERYPDAVFSQIDLTTKGAPETVLAVIEQWRQNKIKANKHYDIEHELQAVTKIMTIDTVNALTLSTVSVNNTPIAFSIDELLPQKYVLSHFSKADNTFSGVYDYMNTKIAEMFAANGYTFWNWEQDLDQTGLREAKSRYRPVSFLKKHTISFAR